MLRLFGWIVAVLTFAGLASPAFAQGGPERPNIIFIMADDLGYGELGSYGQTKIKTPRLDQMAADGMRFTDAYCGSPVCAPSRAVLLTGLHPGHADIRDNKDQPKTEADDYPYQWSIPEDRVTFGEVMKNAGYATACIGKWGLGNIGDSGDPNAHGFDLFYGYVSQWHAHTHYPEYLYRNGQREMLPGNEGNTRQSLTGGTHSHTRFEEEALDFIRENKDGPFLLYLPLAIPHLAIHADEDWLAPYADMEESGPYDGSRGYTAHERPNAAYAAMITRMDTTVGKILDELEAQGIDKNTLVIFTSDNGPTHDVGGVDTEFFNSAGPLRGRKGSMFEGGIRVPFIARWPGQIEAGSVNDTPIGFQDVLPTMAEMAGVDEPVGIDGESILGEFTGEGILMDDRPLYFEFGGYGGWQAVRKGPWKMIRRNLKSDPSEPMLFNLKDDLGEATDVAADHPEIVAELMELAAEMREPNEDFPMPVLDEAASDTQEEN